jgi:hypothetical protein
MNRQTLGYIAFLGFLLAVPAIGIYPVFAMKIMCYALFACAFNLLLGFTGLLSFGHAAFLGAAAYASGHAMKIWGFSPELGIGFGVLVAGVLGLEPESSAPSALELGAADLGSAGGDALNPALTEAGPSDAAIQALVEQRKRAKASRDFATADRLRAELQAQGIELVDKPGGVTIWLRA